MACVVVAPRSGIAKDSAVRLSILRTMSGASERRILWLLQGFFGDFTGKIHTKTGHRGTTVRPIRALHTPMLLEYKISSTSPAVAAIGQPMHMHIHIYKCARPAYAMALASAYICMCIDIYG